jgi:hypothetical protein
MLPSASRGSNLVEASKTDAMGQVAGSTLAEEEPSDPQHGRSRHPRPSNHASAGRFCYGEKYSMTAVIPIRPFGRTVDGLDTAQSILGYPFVRFSRY